MVFCKKNLLVLNNGKMMILSLRYEDKVLFYRSFTGENCQYKLYWTVSSREFLDEEN